jgi:hypothetical protein
MRVSVWFGDGGDTGVTVIPWYIDVITYVITHDCMWVGFSNPE